MLVTRTKQCSSSLNVLQSLENTSSLIHINTLRFGIYNHSKRQQAQFCKIFMREVLFVQCTNLVFHVNQPLVFLPI
ncbi:hypothetical protein T08_15308 [Trichinella sp. T8]|nr:hypothetical protein T08_15308 [Trichinella sp. T8]